jgi:hypothetical protein
LRGDDGIAFDDLLIKFYDALAVNYPKFYKMDNLSKLGLLASEVVLKGRNLKQEYKPDEVGVILSNASSSLDTDMKYYESTKQIASPALFVYTLPNIVMGEICIRQGIKGENGFFVFDAFDASFLSAYVDAIMEQGTKACIAGWVEVLGEQHNVFLYLVENTRQGLALPHTAKQLEQLYR